MSAAAWLAVILFVLAYVLMLTFSRVRTPIALASGVLFVLTGVLPLVDGTGADGREVQGVLSSLDFNSLLMITGTMGLVKLVSDSSMPALLAQKILDRTRGSWGAVWLSLFAGLLATVVGNVAAVLMIVPVVLEVCKRKSANPVPAVIGLTLIANLQGASSLLGGNGPILLGAWMDLDFLDFFWYEGRISLFLPVTVGTVAAAGMLAWVLRRNKGSLPEPGEQVRVTDYVPTVLLGCTVLLLACAGAAPESWNLPEVTDGAICCAMLAVGLVYNYRKYKTPGSVLSPLLAIDYRMLGLLVGLFLMIGGLRAQGVIDWFAGFLAGLGGGSPFLMYTLLFWASLLICAGIDRIPYIATMLPAIPALAGILDMQAAPLFVAVLTGAALGGNLNPIGAAANVAGLDLLRSEGYVVKVGGFFRIAVPMTLAAAVPVYVLIWLLWGRV